MSNGECLGDTFCSRLGIHPGAMPFSVNSTNQAMFVKWQTAESSKLTSQQRRLIETAFAFAIGMERDRNDHVSTVKRIAPLDGKHQKCEPTRDVRLAF